VPAGAGAEAPLPALRILLAEDSPDNRALTLAYLEGTPYRVEIAETGAIACEMFAAGRYDLVLMDRQMPVMDGLTATRTIRAWEQANDRPPTPIIALTASALKGDREMCLAAGCTAFLTKPIKQDVLLRAIKERSMVAPPPSKAESRKDPIVRPAYPNLAPLIPAFLQNRRQDVLTMRSALARGDFETVQRLGHDMKGAGSSFGFQAITNIGAALEQAAAKADTDASRQRVDELSTYLDRVGHGAEFILRLPPSDLPERPAGAPVHAAPRAGGARRIVLVENDDILRGAFRELLEQSGHRVTEARDGIEGLARILAEKPDVAIVDIGLPGIDGHEVARRVRAALGRSVLLVAMTGYGQESDRLMALAGGFDTHLTKPFDIKLVERILETQ
jgi:CheY-like chemotaxis protein